MNRPLLILLFILGMFPRYSKSQIMGAAGAIQLLEKYEIMGDSLKSYEQNKLNQKGNLETESTAYVEYSSGYIIFNLVDEDTLSKTVLSMYIDLSNEKNLDYYFKCDSVREQELKDWILKFQQNYSPSPIHSHYKFLNNASVLSDLSTADSLAMEGVCYTGDDYNISYYSGIDISKENIQLRQDNTYNSKNLSDHFVLKHLKIYIPLNRKSFFPNMYNYHKGNLYIDFEDSSSGERFCREKFTKALDDLGFIERR